MPKAQRPKRGRNRRGFVAIPFSGSISLSTLTNGTVVESDLFSATLGEDLYCISIDGLWSIRDLTPGEVPIHVGYSHDDLAVGEIAEALDAELTDPDDIIARERARRPVRACGVFARGVVADMEINDGKMLRTPLRFSAGDGHNVAMWARNRSGATLTTGAVVTCDGVLYGRWQR